jgi:hypothetical protein
VAGQVSQRPGHPIRNPLIINRIINIFDGWSDTVKVEAAEEGFAPEIRTVRLSYDDRISSRIMLLWLAGGVGNRRSPPEFAIHRPIVAVQQESLVPA